MTVTASCGEEVDLLIQYIQLMEEALNFMNSKSSSALCGMCPLDCGWNKRIPVFTGVNTGSGSATPTSWNSTLGFRWEPSCLMQHEHTSHSSQAQLPTARITGVKVLSVCSVIEVDIEWLSGVFILWCPKFCNIGFVINVSDAILPALLWPFF